LFISTFHGVHDIPKVCHSAVSASTLEEYLPLSKQVLNIDSSNHNSNANGVNASNAKPVPFHLVLSNMDE
jgi:hypothetical protein